MRVLKRSAVLVSFAFALLSSATLNAAIVAQMNLEQMVNASERIFVGKVLGITESRVAMGGGEVPAVTYRIKVSESFKGSFDEIKGEK